MALGNPIGRLAAELALDSREFVTGSTSAQKALGELAAKFTNIGQSVTNAGKTMTKGVTVPLAGIGATVIKFASDFEDGMKGVSIATEASASEMARMKQIALDVGNATTFGASEAAGAMEMLAKAGVPTTVIIEGAAKAVTNLAAAAGSELEPAAAAISDTLAQFRMSAKDLPAIVNQITGAVNESKFSFEDFSYGMAQGGGVAASAGLSFREFATALASTSSQFESGADAGTSLKTFLLSLTPSTKKAAEAFKEAGFSAYDATGQLKPLAVIAEELRTKFGNLSEADLNATFKQMFGTDAIRTAIGLMRQGGDGIEEMDRRIAGTNAADQAAKQMGGLSGQLEQLRGALETLAIAIADTGLLTAFTSIVKTVASFVSGLAQTHPTILKVVVAVAAFAAAMGPLLIVLGTLAATVLPLFLVGLGPIGIAVSALINPFGTLITLLTRFGVTAIASSLLTTGLSAAFGALWAALSPILIPLAALAAAGYLIYRNWDAIAAVFAEFWTQAKQALGPPIQELVATLTGALNELWSGPLGMGIQTAMRWLADLAATIGSVFGQAILNTLGMFLDAIVGILRTVGDAIRVINALLKGDWQGAWNAAASIVTRFFSPFAPLVSAAVKLMQQLYQGVKTWLQDKLSGVWTFVLGKIETVKKAFFNLYDAVVGHSYIPDMVDEIGQNMARLDTLMVDKAADATKKTANKFRELRTLLDELFPEQAQARINAAKFALIDEGQSKGWLTAGAAGEARGTLASNIRGDLPLSFDLAEAAKPMGGMTAATNELAEKLAVLGTRAKETTVRVAKSFKDMADATMQSISNVANAIKGGGFLGILEAVVGLGMQLGSVGVFGKTIANRLNETKGYANGGFPSRGLAMVGERGPELVSFRGGERVFSNADSRSMMGGSRLQVEVVANNNGFGAIVRNHVGQVVAESAPALMAGGAQVAQSRMAYRSTRRVA